MDNLPSERQVTISQLLLDSQNPRLVDTQSNQIDAIRAMVLAQSEKVVSLAQHVVANGINPTSLPIIMPSDEKDFFYVLDGNRRITALKLLETPNLVEGFLPPTLMGRIKTLSTEYKKKPINKINCLVVSNRDQADTWIQLIHRGQNDGAGLVPWDGQVSARYDSRKTGLKTLALQVIDYIKSSESINSKAQDQIDNGKFPVTSLDRLLGTPYVRQKLGLDIVDGKIFSNYPSEEIFKGLSRIVEDLGTKAITVSHIKNQTQRIDYINGFKSDDLPDPTKRIIQCQSLEKLMQEEKTITKPKGRDYKKLRRSLIPRDCTLSITKQSDHRIHEIYFELKKMIINEYPNANAVMMRVFIELSLDYFLSEKIKMIEQQIDNSTLAQKMTSVANYFEENRIMTKHQLTPIRKAIGGQTLLATSVKSMNAFVHNRYYSPIPSELLTSWDDLQNFIEHIWSL